MDEKKILNYGVACQLNMGTRNTHMQLLVAELTWLTFTDPVP